MSDQDNGQVSNLQCPTTNDPEAWKTYWKAQGQSWRTEPEIDAERQKYLAERRAIVPNIEKGIYSFGGIKLTRADVEWLLATHENGHGPVDWQDEAQRKRQGLDMRGANLSHINLSNLPLTCMRSGLIWDEWPSNTEKQPSRVVIQMEGANLSGTHLENAYLIGACLSEANLNRAHLAEACLMGANLMAADLTDADLERVQLSFAHLEGAQFLRANLKVAHLTEAHLARAQFDYAHLEFADLSMAHCEQAEFVGAKMQNARFIGVDLTGANFNKAHLEDAYLNFAILRNIQLSEAYLAGSYLEGVVMADEMRVGPQLVDVHWNDVNLAVAEWSQVDMIKEEYQARQKKQKGEVKDRFMQLEEHSTAIRANRQLAIALQSQGLNEDASRFAYRAQKLQRVVLRLQKKFGQYLFSGFLDLLAGYGYRTGRSVIWYLVTIFGFAIAYFAIGHLPFFPDAFVFSLTSFHGRGFFPGLGSENSLHNPLVIMAAFEAVVGLLIEISFIATFTQRFFGR